MNSGTMIVLTTTAETIFNKLFSSMLIVGVKRWKDTIVPKCKKYQWQIRPEPMLGVKYNKQDFPVVDNHVLKKKKNCEKYLFREEQELRAAPLNITIEIILAVIL